MKLTISFLGVATAACLAAPVSAQTSVTWQNPVNVAASPGTLVKSGGCDQCPDAGAYSSTRITAGGYAEFVPDSGFYSAAGLTAEAQPGTSGALVDFAFSLYPNGIFEVRERGVYKADGYFTAGDRFRIAIESGRAVYRRNGQVVYASTAPTGPLAMSATLLSAGAGLKSAVMYLGSDFDTGDSAPPPPPPPPTSTSTTVWPAGIVSSGPYRAIVERLPHAKPATPVLGLAGSSITDPVFGSRIIRVTDGATRPASPNRSYRTPSSPHQNAWSAAGTYFYTTSTDGSIIPFRFDPAAGRASRVNPTTSGAGGMVMTFYIEPQFSYVNDSVIYGSSNTAPRTIEQYDFSTNTYTRLLDLDSVVPGLAGTYIGGLGSGAGTPERLMAFFGGASQDHHYYAIVFDKTNPAQRLVLNTKASTVNGVATPIPLNFELHHATMDRSGRYVMLYPPWHDLALPRKAAQSYLWDTSTGVFTALVDAARPYGHDAFGYGISVNQDCCTSTTWDAAQWQLRNLATPLVTRDLITTILTPKVVYLDEHTTWNNARPDRAVPVISGVFRSPLSTVGWRAWDDEIIAIQTDAAPGMDATVWRFAHHRTDTRSDIDPMGVSFWYQPRPNVSPDGRWVIFTSNWDKTLGVDPGGDATTMARQDVFIVELRSAATNTTVPVTLSLTAPPAGRVSVAYSAPLAGVSGSGVSGGSGSYVWSVVQGALPAGLTLDPVMGVVGGVPQVAGRYTFTVKVTDAADGANSASAAAVIDIAAAPAPVSAVMPSAAALPDARISVSYKTTLTATGGSGKYLWAAAGLPTGLTVNATTGVVSGTPRVTGTFAVGVAVSDLADPANSATVIRTLKVVAGVRVSSPRTLPPATAGVPYSYQVLATNVVGTAQWNMQGGSLPPGMSFSASGLLSGTCATKGTWWFNARVKDASSSNTLTLTIVVN